MWKRWWLKTSFAILFVLNKQNERELRYVLQLRDHLESSKIANSTDTKQEAKPTNIEFWHLRMGYLSYRSLKTLKNLSSKIDIKDIALKKLYEDCQKGNQTCQLSQSCISQSTKFLGRVHSYLEGPFPRTRQGYRYYISF